MAFNVPTLKAVIQRTKADIESELAGSDAFLPRSVEYALARVLAGLSKGIYTYGSWVFDQCFPDTAEKTYFWRWGNVFVGQFQKTAVPWRGTYQFTGVDSTVIPAGTQVQRVDGQTYSTDDEVTIASGAATADLTADESSLNSNLETGQTLSLVSPISGVDADGTVQSTTQTGTDDESVDEGRDRLLALLARPESADGGPGFYETKALEIAGVTRAWEFANLEAPNSVSVAFARDNDEDVAPSSLERQEVLDHLIAESPITVEPRVITTVEIVENFQISSLVPDTPSVRSAIESSLKDLLLNDGAPGKTITLSQINGAISRASGEQSHVLDSPSDSLVYDTTQIPTFGTLTVV